MSDRQIGEWRALRPGVDIRILHDEAATGRRIAYLRYAPGASVPHHVHRGDEHVIMLAGAQHDEAGRHAVGTYRCNRAGSGHSVWSPEGCLALIRWDGPIAFQAADAAPGGA